MAHSGAEDSQNLVMKKFIILISPWDLIKDYINVTLPAVLLMQQCLESRVLSLMKRVGTNRC